MTGYKLMSRKCDQCLLSKNRIVSAARAQGIMEETRRKDCGFECHKGSIARQKIACRGHFDATGGGQVGRIAERLGLLVEIDPDTLEPVQEPTPLETSR